jgi:hypothetical protein
MKESEESPESERPSDQDQGKSAEKLPATLVTGSGEGSVVERGAKNGDDTSRSTDPTENPIKSGLWAWISRRWTWVKDPKHSSAVQAIFTAVIMLTGIAYTVFAGLQWGISRDSLVAAQRAFLVYQGTESNVLVKVDKEGHHPYFHFSAIIENSGTTPARGVVQAFAGGNVMPEEPDERTFLSADRSPAHIVGPKGTIHFGGISRDVSYIIPQPPSDLGETFRTQELPGRRIPFWGWITYRDIFPSSDLHVTEWCQIIGQVNARPNTPGSEQKIIWDVYMGDCQNHNCADRDCPDYKQVVAIQR